MLLTGGLQDMLGLLFHFCLSFLSIYSCPLCKSPLSTFKCIRIPSLSSWRYIFQSILICFHLNMLLSSLLHGCHFHMCLHHLTGKSPFTSFSCWITWISHPSLSWVSSLSLTKHSLVVSQDRVYKLHTTCLKYWYSSLSFDCLSGYRILDQYLLDFSAAVAKPKASVTLNLRLSLCFQYSEFS